MTVRIRYELDATDDDVTQLRSRMRDALSDGLLELPRNMNDWHRDQFEKLCDKMAWTAVIHMAAWAATRKEQQYEGCTDSVPFDSKTERPRVPSPPRGNTDA